MGCCGDCCKNKNEGEEKNELSFKEEQNNNINKNGEEGVDIVNPQQIANNNEIEENKEDVLLIKISHKFNKIYFNVESERKKNHLIQNNKTLKQKAHDLIKKHREIGIKLRYKETDNKQIEGNCNKEIEEFSKEVGDFLAEIKRIQKYPKNMALNISNVEDKLNYLHVLNNSFLLQEETQTMLKTLFSSYKEYLSFYKKMNESDLFEKETFFKIQNQLFEMFKKMAMNYGEKRQKVGGENVWFCANVLIIKFEELCDKIIEQYEEIKIKNPIENLNNESGEEEKHSSSLHLHSYQGDKFNENIIKKAGLNLDDKNKTDNLNKSFSHH